MLRKYFKFENLRGSEVDRKMKKVFSEFLKTFDFNGDPTGNRTPVSGVRELQYHPINAETPDFSLQEIQENTSDT
jgi:hypothetical protein